MKRNPRPTKVQNNIPNTFVTTAEEKYYEAPIKCLKVLKIPYSRFMSDKAKSLVDQYNSNPSNPLYLEVFDSEENCHRVSDIFINCYYAFKSLDSELVNMLNIVTAAASAVYFDIDDVEVVDELPKELQ